MGNICKATTIGIVDTYERVDIKQFRKLKVFDGEKESDEIIGVGGFAVVYRVRKIGDDSTDYAMKTMNKILVSQNKNIQPTLSEMFILRDIQHPFLIDMRWAFNDATHLYLIMKELKGKDLRFHINHFKLRDDQILRAKQQELDIKTLSLENKECSINLDEQANKPPVELSAFNENQARYIIAQVCLALNYIHSKRIIHRDIKPENILFENDGYLRITDMGIAKVFRPNNNTDTSGTPGYMAPEVLCRQNHNYAVDYYAVGVITFELMFNKRPYENEDKSDRKDLNYRNELIKNILQQQIYVQPYNKESFGTTQEKEVDQQKYSVVTAPPKWSLNGIDFINKRKPTERLGYYDITEVINHPWFQGIDFDILLKKGYTIFPFNKAHMLRSEKRAKVMKFLEEQVSKIDKKIASQLQKQMEEEAYYRNRQSNRENQVSSESDHPDDEDDIQNNSNNINNRQISPSNNFIPRINNPLYKNYNNPKEQFNFAKQDPGLIKMKEIEQLRQKEKEIIGTLDDTPENKEKLRSIQHFFSNYYFDRDRYNYELKYLEERRLKALQNGRKRCSKDDDNNIIAAGNNNNINIEFQKNTMNTPVRSSKEYQLHVKPQLQQQQQKQFQFQNQTELNTSPPPALSPLAFPDVILTPEEEYTPNSISAINATGQANNNPYSISKSFARASMVIPSSHKSSQMNINVSNPLNQSSLSRSSASTGLPQLNASFNHPNSNNSSYYGDSMRLDKSMDAKNNGNNTSMQLYPEISIKPPVQQSQQQLQPNKSIFNQPIKSFAQVNNNQFQV